MDNNDIMMTTPFFDWNRRIKEEKTNAIIDLIKLELLSLSIYLAVSSIFMMITHINLTKPGVIIGCMIIIAITAISNMKSLTKSICMSNYCSLYLDEILDIMESKEMIDYAFSNKLYGVTDLTMNNALIHLERLTILDDDFNKINESLKDVGLDTVYNQMRQKAEFESEVCFNLVKAYAKSEQPVQEE